MDQRGGAKPQTVKRRSRPDDVTFGAQHARKRRQIVISDDDESEFDEFDEFDEEKDDVKREYVGMLRAAREDIKERGQWDPIDEAIEAAQARINLDDPRVDDMLRRMVGTMRLKACISELAAQVVAHPDTTLGVALSCLDASPEAAAKLIVALAADEDLNRFWPVLSQWEAWVKSKEMGRGWRPTAETVGDTVWRLFNISSDAAKASIGRSKIQFLINCCAWANCC